VVTGGVAATVTVNLNGITPSAATLQQIDKNNVNCTSGTASAPTAQNLNISQPLTVTFPGYGLAVLDITPSGTTNPPVISNVTVGSTTASSTTVSWSTDTASDSQVEYGTTTAYGSSTALNTSIVTSHSLLLSGLSPSTLYHYRAKSKDASGNLSTSPDSSFTTTAGSTSKVGDINGDGIVDIFDLSILLSSYGITHTICSTNASYTCDLNGDGKVDILDLSVLLSHYGT